MAKICKYLKTGAINKSTQKEMNDISIFSLAKEEDLKTKIYKLFYAKIDARWTEPFKGKMAAKLVNHGNGITVSFPDGKVLELDYSQMDYLKLLLREVSLDSWYTKTVKDVKIEK